jgi:hypothetical protein
MTNLPPAAKQHIRSLGGEAEVFACQLCVYSFPEDTKVWEAVRDAEIDAALDGLRKAMASWADVTRRQKLKESL